MRVGIVFPWDFTYGGFRPPRPEVSLARLGSRRRTYRGTNLTDLIIALVGPNVSLVRTGLGEILSVFEPMSQLYCWQQVIAGKVLRRLSGVTYGPEPEKPIKRIMDRGILQSRIKTALVFTAVMLMVGAAIVMVYLER